MPKRKSASRIRYEQRNPTISCRVSAEFREELTAHLERTGQSMSQWIQDGFGGREVTVKEAKQAYWRGWKMGAERAISDLSLNIAYTGPNRPLKSGQIVHRKRWKPSTN